jgi:prophage maintenance system killer protein
MRYLTLAEVLEIYRRVMEQSGGAIGLLDLGGLESAIAQPRMTFNQEELYPTLVEKAAALGFSLIQNHPFVDGNKRTVGDLFYSPRRSDTLLQHLARGACTPNRFRSFQAI